MEITRLCRGCITLCPDSRQASHECKSGPRVSRARHSQIVSPSKIALRIHIWKGFAKHCSG